MIAWAVIGGLVVVFFLIFTFSLMKVSAESAEVEEAAVREIESAPKPTWVKYPVPLEDEIQQFIGRKCAEYQISPAVVLAVIGTESQYNVNAIGDHGNSFGLMQIYQSVHRDRMERLGVTNLLNPYQNVTVGIDFLSELLDKDNGLEWALSFYSGNGGAECEYAEKVMRLAECILEGAVVING